MSAERPVPGSWATGCKPTRQPCRALQVSRSAFVWSASASTGRIACVKLVGPALVRACVNRTNIFSSASAGDPVAQCELGCMYAQGESVSKDFDEAEYWLRRSANQGHVAAQFNLGLFLYYRLDSGRRIREAKDWIRAAGENGNAVAQNFLAWLLATGINIRKDVESAAQWYRKAAEQGHAGSQYNLGLMYSRGEGVVRDSAEAVRWFSKAAEQGDADAQYELGLAHAKGDGVARNGAEALRLWLMSVCGQYSLPRLTICGSDTPSLETIHQCREAAEQGSADAQYRLGELWHYATEARCNVRADASAFGPLQLVSDSDQRAYEAEMIKWWKLAGDQGHRMACYNLGVVYSTGMWGAENPTEAVFWYRKAGEQGDVEAQYYLSLMYAAGDGVARDFGEAFRWCQEAAQNGFTNAHYLLALMYATGQGVAKNDTLALASVKMCLEYPAPFREAEDLQSLLEEELQQTDSRVL